VVEEVISLLSDAGHGQVVPKQELIRVIRAAGRVPVERDALYRVVRRYDRESTAFSAGAAGTAGWASEATV
jgi:2-iminoacetate synthase ThiH